MTDSLIFGTIQMMVWVLSVILAIFCVWCSWTHLKKKPRARVRVPLWMVLSVGFLIAGMPILRFYPVVTDLTALSKDHWPLAPDYTKALSWTLYIFVLTIMLKLLLNSWERSLLIVGCVFVASVAGTILETI